MNNQAVPTVATPELFQRAMQCHQGGDLSQAEALYQQILQQEPSHPDALHFLGVLAYQKGQNEVAVGLINQAIRVYPTSSPMYCNLGLTLQAQGKLDAAVSSYRHALSLRPDYTEARSNLGSAFAAQNNITAAIESYRYALLLKPSDAQLQSYLAQLQKLNPTVKNSVSENALSLSQAEAHYECGRIHHSRWHLEQAVDSYKKALGIKLDYPEAHHHLGIALQDQCQMDEAMKYFRFALSLKPDYAAAYYHLGLLFYLQGKLDTAIDSYQQALAVQPDYAQAEQMLFYTQLHCCDWLRYYNSCEKIINSTLAGQQGNRPFQFLAFSAKASLQQHYACAYVAEKFPLSETPLWTGQLYQHDKIRIAYVSDDFREHPVAYLIAGLLEQHDRERFEIIAISFSPEDGSGIGQRIKHAFNRFVDVSQMGNYEAAVLMRELEIDIAIDLMGFTSYSRTAVFSFRPAPIQVNYLGYPSTMGADYMDYIIADKQLIPLEQQSCYTEKVVYLPDTYFVNDSKRGIAKYTSSRQEANLPETGIVFCCFNNHYKIAPDIFAIWMRLLGKVENSVLWLSAANPFATANLRKEAMLHGISPERLVFAPKLEKIEDHFARHRLADLFLDTLPYNAHTTTSDALWAGLPVLTCIGDTFAGRVAGSLLQAIGLPELITHSLEEYEALAFKLATTPILLAEIRAKLAHNRDSFPLFDTDRFRRHIESAYITMWKRYQRGESPTSFAVQAIN